MGAGRWRRKEQRSGGGEHGNGPSQPYHLFGDTKPQVSPERRPHRSQEAGITTFLYLFLVPLSSMPIDSHPPTHTPTHTPPTVVIHMGSLRVTGHRGGASMSFRGRGRDGGAMERWRGDGATGDRSRKIRDVVEGKIYARGRA